MEALTDTPAVTPQFEGQCNFMDPESRITRTGQDRFRPYYNAQIVVDADSQLIVTTAIALFGSDQGQSPRLHEAALDSTATFPRGCWQMLTTSLNGTCRIWTPGPLTDVAPLGQESWRADSGDKPCRAR